MYTHTHAHAHTHMHACCTHKHTRTRDHHVQTHKHTCMHAAYRMHKHTSHVASYPAFPTPRFLSLAVFPDFYRLQYDWGLERLGTRLSHAHTHTIYVTQLTDRTSELARYVLPVG